MPVMNIIGLQWGDEGKGKIVDTYAQEADVVARYGGGGNAGHTLVTEQGKIVLNHVPAGILSPRVRHCILGRGMVVDPETLLRELAELRALGIALDGRVLISACAQLVMPWHKAADAAAEAEATTAIGTTKRGIGPCYTDKIARTGLAVGEMLDLERLRQRVSRMIEKPPPHSPFGLFIRTTDAARLDADLKRWHEELAGYITDTDAILRAAWQHDETIILEGAQGTLIDLEHGSYPFVTSSLTGSAGACAGSGLPPAALGRVIGVAKAYATRVGHGPFPTELVYGTGDELRQKGGEFGATTGRPRRCGWFDVPLMRYAIEVEGVHELVLTKLDVLTGFPLIGVAAVYMERHRKGGVVREEVRTTATSADVRAVSSAFPLIRWFDGWSKPIDGATVWEQLPQNARCYVEQLEAMLGVRISAVTTGAHRDAIIRRGQ